MCMKKIAIVFLAACIVLVAGCRWVGIRGNGHIKTDERPVSVSRPTKICFLTSIPTFQATHFICARASRSGQLMEFA